MNIESKPGPSEPTLRELREVCDLVDQQRTEIARLQTHLEAARDQFKQFQAAEAAASEARKLALLRIRADVDQFHARAQRAIKSRDVVVIALRALVGAMELNAEDDTLTIYHERITPALVAAVDLLRIVDELEGK